MSGSLARLPFHAYSALRHNRIATQPKAIASRGNTTAPMYAPLPPGRRCRRKSVTTNRRTNQNTKNALARVVTVTRKRRMGSDYVSPRAPDRDGVVELFGFRSATTWERSHPMWNKWMRGTLVRVGERCCSSRTKFGRVPPVPDIPDRSCLGPQETVTAKRQYGSESSSAPCAVGRPARTDPATGRTLVESAEIAFPARRAARPSASSCEPTYTRDFSGVALDTLR